MSSLIAIIYPSEDKAEEVRQRLIGLQKEYLLTLGDAVIATKTDAGKVKLNQLMNLTAAGAASGSVPWRPFLSGHLCRRSSGSVGTFVY